MALQEFVLLVGFALGLFNPLSTGPSGSVLTSTTSSYPSSTRIVSSPSITTSQIFTSPSVQTQTRVTSVQRTSTTRQTLIWRLPVLRFNPFPSYGSYFIIRISSSGPAFYNPSGAVINLTRYFRRPGDLGTSWAGRYLRNARKYAPVYGTQFSGCGAEVLPVCARGKTYNNPCLAGLASVSLVSVGSCAISESINPISTANIPVSPDETMPVTSTSSTTSSTSTVPIGTTSTTDYPIPGSTDVTATDPNSFPTDLSSTSYEEIPIDGGSTTTTTSTSQEVPVGTGSEMIGSTRY